MNTMVFIHPQIKTVPPIVFAVYIAIGIMLNSVVALNFVDTSSIWTMAVGYILLLDGASLVYLAMSSLRKHETSVATWRPATRLVNTGVFRYSRNPIYLGMFLAYIGFALTTANPWLMLLVIPLYLQMVYTVIRKEEDYLSATFGDEYIHYKSTVNRWVTFTKLTKR